MCTEVYRHQHIETGGNLFGLWTTWGNAVIDVVLGPGKNCRRTTTSFHQDIEYMHRVGRFVNDNYMLCHIGEWHSHHNLSLNKPTSADEQTIRHNFPQGVTKFLVIFANIKSTDTIVLSPYFFTDGGRRYEKAEYVVLNDDGPFSTDDKIVEQIQLGAEGSVDQRNKTTLVEKTNNRRNVSHKTRNQQDTGSKYELDGKTSSTCVQANQSLTPSGLDASSLSQVNAPKPNSTHNQSISNFQADRSPSGSQNIPSGSTLRDSVEPMDTDNTHHIPSEDEKDTSSSSASPPSVPQTVTLAGNQVDPDRNKNDGETPSEREIVLKKIYDQLSNWFGTQSESAFNFETSKDCPGAIEISFKHNNKYWLVRFSAEFPTTPAKLFYSTREASLRSRECSQFHIVAPLINDVNILLTMKNICDGCSICKNFTKELLSQPDYSSRFMEKFAVAIYKLVTELDNTFPDFTELKVNHPVDTSYATITFNHGTKWWIINVPLQFPDVPAKVYNQSHKESFHRRDVMLYENESSSPRDLNSSKLIIKAINCNCSCSTCEDMCGQYQ